MFLDFRLIRHWHCDPGTIIVAPQAGLRIVEAQLLLKPLAGMVAQNPRVITPCEVLSLGVTPCVGLAR
jgi:hypothetical protein